MQIYSPRVIGRSGRVVGAMITALASSLSLIASEEARMLLSSMCDRERPVTIGAGYVEHGASLSVRAFVAHQDAAVPPPSENVHAIELLLKIAVQNQQNQMMTLRPTEAYVLYGTGMGPLVALRMVGERLRVNRHGSTVSIAGEMTLEEIRGPGARLVLGESGRHTLTISFPEIPADRVFACEIWSSPNMKALPQLEQWGRAGCSK